MYAPLLDLLPTAHDADRPWLVCYGPRQRTELTGHVLAMWHAKTAALITAESPGVPPESDGLHIARADHLGRAVHIGTGAHWRGVVWACGAWLAGRQVVAGDGQAVGSAGLAPGTSVALDPEGLCPQSQVQVLVPRQDLAVRWPGELPPLVVDGAADLMAYPDRFDPVPASDEVCLAEVGTQVSPQVGSGAGDAARARAEATTRAQDVSLHTYRVADLVGGVGASAPDGLEQPAQAGAVQDRRRAVLVREHGLGPALRGVLAAWRAGLTAVLLTEDADDGVAAAAARQEGATR